MKTAPLRVALLGRTGVRPLNLVLWHALTGTVFIAFAFLKIV